MCRVYGCAQVCVDVYRRVWCAAGAPGQLPPSSSLGVICSLLSDHDAGQAVITASHAGQLEQQKFIFSV